MERTPDHARDYDGPIGDQYRTHAGLPAHPNWRIGPAAESLRPVRFHSRPTCSVRQGKERRRERAPPALALRPAVRRLGVCTSRVVGPWRLAHHGPSALRPDDRGSYWGSAGARCSRDGTRDLPFRARDAAVATTDRRKVTVATGSARPAGCARAGARHAYHRRPGVRGCSSAPSAPSATSLRAFSDQAVPDPPGPGRDRVRSSNRGGGRPRPREAPSPSAQSVASRSISRGARALRAPSRSGAAPLLRRDLWLQFRRPRRRPGTDPLTPGSRTVAAG